LEEELVLNIEEYATLNDPELIKKECVDWLNSTLPDGAMVINTGSISINIKRNGIEREFN
jgi:hypothetical protein